jgi:hypothetical protein
MVGADRQPAAQVAFEPVCGASFGPERCLVASGDLRSVKGAKGSRSHLLVLLSPGLHARDGSSIRFSR